LIDDDPNRAAWEITIVRHVSRARVTPRLAARANHSALLISRARSKRRTNGTSPARGAVVARRDGARGDGTRDPRNQQSSLHLG
jgi:hypothetical protein